MPDYKIIDSIELFPADELECQLIELPSGERVIRFENCTGKPPIIYMWCLDMANEWIAEKKGREMTDKNTDWLDDQEFYEVCQQYRHAGDGAPRFPGIPNAAEAFQQLKDYIRDSVK